MQRSSAYHRSGGRRGSALVVVLLVSVVLTILVTTLLGTRVSETRAIAGTMRATNAQLIAEAGVDYVLGLVLADDQTLPASDPYYSVDGADFGGGTFSVIADQEPTTGQFRVTSTGREVRGTERTVEVLFDIARTNRIVDEYGLFTCGDLVLTGSSSVVNGDVYTGGTLTIQRANAISNGDATAFGDVAFDGGGSITGNLTSETGTVSLIGGNPNLVRVGGDVTNPETRASLAAHQVGGELRSPPPDLAYCDPASDLYNDELVIDLTEYYPGTGDPVTPHPDLVGAESYGGTNETPGFHVTSGSLGGYGFQRIVFGDSIIEGLPDGQSFDGGVYFIDGDLTVRGNFSGSATFVVTGSLVVEGDTTSASGEDDRAYIVEGDVSMAGSSQIDGVVYTNSDVLVGEGGATVNGGLFALGDGDLNAAGNLTVNVQDPGNIDLGTTLVPDFTVQRWRLVTN